MLPSTPTSHLGEDLRVIPELRGPLGWFEVYFVVWLLHATWSLFCSLG